MTECIHQKQTNTRHLYKADAISFAYNAVRERERGNQAVTNFGVRFSDFVEKIFQISLTFIYLMSRFLGRRIIFCRRLNLANFSVTNLLFRLSVGISSVQVHFWIQILQNLFFPSLVWLKSYKICPSQALFDINKSIFKQFFLPIFKPKTGLQVADNVNLQYFSIF